MSSFTRSTSFEEKNFSVKIALKEILLPTLLMTEAQILSLFEEVVVEKVLRKLAKFESRKKKPTKRGKLEKKSTKPQMTNLFCPELRE